MFRSPASGNQQNRKRRSGVSTEGFGRLGLGQPSTLWLGQDQTTWPNLVTRYGFPWSLVVNAPGSLTLDQASWGFGTNTRLVVIGNGGIAVKVGLECTQMASGSQSIQFDFTHSGPIYWPAAFGSLQLPFVESNGQVAASSSRLTPLALTSATQGQVAAAIAAATVTPPASVTTALGFDTTVTRRGLFACTSQVRGGNRVWQSRLRTAAGEFTITSGPVVSVTTGVAFSTLTMGYRETPPASYGSSNLGFGGACCWKGVGASDAQLTAILDNWETLYPLS